MITFAELARTVHDLVALLAPLSPTAPVAVRLPNIWEYVALEIAIPAAAGVIMPLPLALGPAEIEWTMSHSGAVRMITGADLPALFAQRPESPHSNAQAPNLAPGGPSAIKPQPLEPGSASGGPAPPPPPPPADPSRIVEVALTSGTTGMPKLAGLSAKLKQATFEGFTSRLEVTEEDRILVMSPLTQGIGGMCLLCLRLGASLIMLHEPRFTPDLVLRLAARHRATMLVGVPTNVIRMVDSPFLAGGDRYAGRVTAVAGAPMPPEVARQWEDRTRSKVCIFYGSMDAGQLSVGSPSDPRHKRHTTVGRPHECCEVLITADGEICMRGDTVQERYWGEERGPHGPDGWVHMGDLGHLDDEGYLSVVGRKKDLVIRGGSNINPHEVEGVIRRHPAIADVCVVGRPDRELGERSVAFVVARPPNPGPDLQQLRAHLEREGLARYKWPEEIIPIDEIPLSGPGKVNRQALREKLQT